MKFQFEVHYAYLHNGNTSTRFVWASSIADAIDQNSKLQTNPQPYVVYSVNIVDTQLPVLLQNQPCA